MVVRKRVGGQVEYNNGEFAEIQAIGIEGIEKDLWLDTIQIHCRDTEDTPEEFQRRFPVGMRLSILTTTEITPWLCCDYGDQRDELREFDRQKKTHAV